MRSNAGPYDVSVQHYVLRREWADQDRALGPRIARKSRHVEPRNDHWDSPRQNCPSSSEISLVSAKPFSRRDYLVTPALTRFQLDGYFAQRICANGRYVRKK